jgi:hypothetical protein
MPKGNKIPEIEEGQTTHAMAKGKKTERTNNDLQNTTQKTKDRIQHKFSFWQETGS